VWRHQSRERTEISVRSDPHIVNQNGLSLLLIYLGQETLDAQLDRTKAFSLAMTPDLGLWATIPQDLNPSGMNPVQNGSAFTPMDIDLVNNRNIRLMGTLLPVFRCPSDPSDPLIPADKAPSNAFNLPITPTAGPGGPYAGAKTSYEFVTDADLEKSACNSWQQPIAFGHGLKTMFGQNSHCSIARVTDGMSNTIMLAETCGEACPGWGYRSTMFAGVSPGGGINRWVPGHFGVLADGAAPGSFHPGGCFFAMGDGTVRWVQQGVSQYILARMSTIADGEHAAID
jgi:hypothetical protein